MLKRIDENYIEMYNCIFHSGDKSVCIAVSVPDSNMTDEEMKNCMMNAARNLFKLNDI